MRSAARPPRHDLRLPLRRALSFALDLQTICVGASFQPMKRLFQRFPTGRWFAFGLLLVTGFPFVPAISAPIDQAPAPRPLQVLTSFLPVHSLALAVGGDRAQVENWIPQGVDPHDFQFSPRDLRRLRGARLLVIGGLQLEGWKADQLRRASGNERLALVEAAAHLPESALVREIATGASGSAHDDGHDHDPGHDHGPAGGANPHFWLDPLLGAHAVTNLVNAFSAADPAHGTDYSANGRACVARLKAIDAEYREALGPLQTKAFITYHNAFPYLARRYGLRLAGVVESTAAEDPSARELAALAALVRREQVQVLFVDGPPTRLARRLATDLKLKLATLETLETGKLGLSAYEEGLRRNLKALQDGLSGPPRP